MTIALTKKLKSIKKWINKILLHLQPINNQKQYIRRQNLSASAVVIQPVLSQYHFRILETPGHFPLHLEHPQACDGPRAPNPEILRIME